VKLAVPGINIGTGAGVPSASNENGVSVLKTVRSAWAAVPKAIAPTLTALAVLSAISAGAAATLFWFRLHAVAFVAGYVSILMALAVLLHCGSAAAVGKPAPWMPWVFLRRIVFWKSAACTFLIVSAAVAAALAAFGGIYQGWGSMLRLSPGSRDAAYLALAAFSSAYFAGIAIALKLSLVIPSVADTGNASFRSSWVRTRGSAMKIWFAYVVATFPLSVIPVFLQYLTRDTALAPALPFLSAASACLNALVTGAVCGSAHVQLAVKEHR